MPVFSKYAAFAAVAYMASITHAHMMMASPVPYGKSSLNNSPLAGDGSDFPCKQRPGVYDAQGASNTAAIGVPQTLSFIGGATHGGGSCQVSLTTDLQPTKNSKWMVIKSIIGGCPASAPGNLNENAASTGASVFNWTVPAGIKPGEYTIAWTWFNHVGNREMYMNCGPLTVTAAQKQRKRYEPAPKVSKRQSTFPDMFVANIGTCHTPDSVDLIFENPGADVQTAGLGPFTTASCDMGLGGAGAAQQATVSAPAAGSATGSAASATSTGASSAAPPSSATGFASGNGQYSQAAGGADTGSVPTSTATSSSFSNPGNQVIPVTPVGTPSATMSAPIYTNSSSIPQTAAPTSTAPAAAPVTGGASAGKQSGACSNEGWWNCIDGSSFQRCGSGFWSAATPMSGMQCTPGESSDFVMKPVVKRFEGGPAGSREHFNQTGFQTQVSHSHAYPTGALTGSWSPPTGSLTGSFPHPTGSFFPHHTGSTGPSASPSEY